MVLSFPQVIQKRRDFLEGPLEEEDDVRLVAHSDWKAVASLHLNKGQSSK